MNWSKTLKLLLFIVFLILVNFSLSEYNNFKQNQKLDKATKLAYNKITFSEAISQLFNIYAELDKLPFIYKIKPGAIMIHDLTIPHKRENGKRIQDLSALQQKISQINNWYTAHNLPTPLWSVDQEGGMVNRIQNDIEIFPSAMALGEAFIASLPLEKIQRVGLFTCLQLKELGITWNFAPVADVQSNPNNPVIQTRSFSDDAPLVSQLAQAFSQGTLQGGCISTYKHFPGHGNTATDSHFALPLINKSFDEINRIDLLPFASANSSFIMPAHILLPQIDSKPATISRKWLTEIGRQQLKYKGLYISDDMGMQGIIRYYKSQKIRPQNISAQSAIDALKAGINVLLVSKNAGTIVTKMIAGLKAKANKDASFKALLKKRILTIIKFKIKQHNFKSPAPLSDADTSITEIKKLNQLISQKAIKRLLGQTQYQEKVQTIITDLEKHSQATRLLSASGKKIIFLKNTSASTLTNICRKQPRVFALLTHAFPKPLQFVRRCASHTRLIVFATDSIFPARSWLRLMQKDDTLVSSFSRTQESILALTKALLARRPIALSHYKYSYSKKSPLP